MVQQASIAEARAELSALVNKVAHGKERIILTSRGRPKAALVSLEDLEALGTPTSVESRMAALREAAEVAEAIRRDHGGHYQWDSAEDIRQMREERMDQIWAAVYGESDER